MCRAYIDSTLFYYCTVALWTLAHQTWNTHTSVLTFHNLCDSWIEEQQWIFRIAHLVISNYSQYRLSLAAKWWFPWPCTSSFALSHAPTGVWLEVASSHALYGLTHLVPVHVPSSLIWLADLRSGTIINYGMNMYNQWTRQCVYEYVWKRTQYAYVNVWQSMNTLPM